MQYNSLAEYRIRAELAKKRASRLICPSPIFNYSSVIRKKLPSQTLENAPNKQKTLEIKPQTSQSSNQTHSAFKRACLVQNLR